LGQRHREGRLGRLRLLRVGLRLVAELGVPVVLLAGVRLVIGGQMGAQSWFEILSGVPDFGAWLWAVCLLVLLTGAIRLVLTARVLRRGDGGPGRALSIVHLRRYPT
jgi:hypothetical protein